MRGMASTITAEITPLVFSGHLEASADAVSAHLTGMRRELALRGHPDAAEPDWELVLAELLNNIVEHAYGAGPIAGVEYWLMFAADGLAGRLVDSGAPMPGLALPAGVQAPLDGPVADLPEGGFGWNLIRRLTTRLEYRREDGRNLLDFAMHGHMQDRSMPEHIHAAEDVGDPSSANPG